MITILVSVPIRETLHLAAITAALAEAAQGLQLTLEVMNGDVPPPTYETPPDVLVLTSTGDSLSKFCRAITAPSPRWYVPIDPMGQALTPLKANSEDEAWENLRRNSHMPGRERKDFETRGYRVDPL